MAPLQAPWVLKRLKLDPQTPLTEMRLLKANGDTIGGADAIVEVARQIWWGWPVFALSRIPGMMPLFRALYRGVAARRHCLGKGTWATGLPEVECTARGKGRSSRGDEAQISRPSGRIVRKCETRDLGCYPARGLFNHSSTPPLHLCPT